MFRVWQIERAKGFHGSLACRGAAHESVVNRPFGHLIQQGHRRVERRGGTLRNVGNPHATRPASASRIQAPQVGSLQNNPTVSDATTGPRECERREPDRGLPGAGFADETQHLAARQLQINAIHEDSAGLGLDPQTFDAQNHL
jgi:hypothetical protein